MGFVEKYGLSHFWKINNLKSTKVNNYAIPKSAELTAIWSQEPRQMENFRQWQFATSSTHVFCGLSDTIRKYVVVILCCNCIGFSLFISMFVKRTKGWVKKKPDKLLMLFWLDFWYHKKSFYTSKKTIFIAFKIDIRISYSSKNIEMTYGTVKLCFFKKCKFYN